MKLYELYEEAARVAKMEEAYPNIYPMRIDNHYYRSKALIGYANFEKCFEELEFALAIVEGKPVFKGDELYDMYGTKCTVNFTDIHNLKIDSAYFESYSWNPPKRTVMIELLVDDVKNMIANQFINHRTAIACSKALENSK